VATWGKERIELSDLHPAMTVGQVKEQLYVITRILPSRQKWIGLSSSSSSSLILTDEMILSEVKSKRPEIIHDSTIHRSLIRHCFILMGTAEDKMLIDPQSIPTVVDDFDLDFNAGSEEWLEHVATGCNLKKFTELTVINIMNEPRPGKPLLVLDLDHTLLDFSSKPFTQQQQQTSSLSNGIGPSSSSSSTLDTIQRMKRPYMDEFLATVYPYFDLVVWSQTSWKWLEIKLIELDMLTNRHYKFCFVLDKTSMFSITSTKRDGSKMKHYVKPLQIIWSKFQSHWNEKNTIHLDDLSRNFALNIHNGFKITPYYRKSTQDMELLALGPFLQLVAMNNNNNPTTTDFRRIQWEYWLDVVTGKKTLKDITRDEKKDSTK